MNMISVEVGDKVIRVKRINNDINGNPRYVVHYLDLGLTKYESSPHTRGAGLSIYRGKDFGGGFVFQSYNLEESLKYTINKLNS